MLLLGPKAHETDKRSGKPVEPISWVGDFWLIQAHRLITGLLLCFALYLFASSAAKEGVGALAAAATSLSIAEFSALRLRRRKAKYAEAIQSYDRMMRRLTR